MIKKFKNFMKKMKKMKKYLSFVLTVVVLWTGAVLLCIKVGGMFLGFIVGAVLLIVIIISALIEVI